MSRRLAVSPIRRQTAAAPRVLRPGDNRRIMPLDV
jgi:hypothetical protein